MLVGILVTYVTFQAATQLEDRAVRIEQKRVTDLVSDALSKELEISLGVLSSISGFFLASDFVSRDEFTVFTEPALTAHSSIHALEWAPHIIDSEREAYRNQAIRDGFRHFVIRERNSQGEMIPATQRPEYFPVYYVEPIKQHEAALGFDLASDEKRIASLEKARQTRRPQATASITLVQENAQHKGFLVFHPIFKLVNGELNQQQTSFQGFALGVFRVGDLIEAAIRPIKKRLGQLRIEVADVTDLTQPDLLFSRSTASQSRPLPDSTWRAKRTIHFVNRNWQISTIATPEFIAQHKEKTHWLVLAAGIILTTLLSAYIHTVTRRTLMISRLVEQRTQALQSSEQLNRSIVENAVDAIITIDKKGCINFFSPAAIKMFGYSNEEVIGQNVMMLMPEPYRSEHDGYLLHHVQTGEKRIIGSGREVVGQHKDGHTFPIHLAVGEAHVDNQTLFVGTISDLTELKKNAQTLRDFRDRLDLATHSGGIGVWEYDIVSDELIWDDRMFTLFGVDREQSPGAYEALQQALHPDDIVRTQAELNEAISGGAPFDTEFRVLWPDDQQRYIHATAVVLFDDNEQATRMIGTNIDITEHKRSEQALREAREVAETANQQKSAFLSIMSHELRTPLTIVLGYLPVLQNRQQVPSPELVTQIADEMNSSGQHLLEMINDLLDISKIEAGQMELRRKEINSLPLIQEIVSRFKHQAQQKGLRLLTDAEDFNFQADELRLRQILINLLGNAMKFTQEGRITISAYRNNDCTTFNVSDTGIGIPDAELPFVFETFRQVDNSSTRKSGGSGLGLAICKKLVELHGGSIGVTSKQDAGTTFTFTIKDN